MNQAGHNAYKRNVSHHGSSEFPWVACSAQYWSCYRTLNEQLWPLAWHVPAASSDRNRQQKTAPQTTRQSAGKEHDDAASSSTWAPHYAAKHEKTMKFLTLEILNIHSMRRLHTAKVPGYLADNPINCDSRIMFCNHGSAVESPVNKNREQA